ncbi:MAG TPA: ATP-binding protein, partial [Polyangiales bacterium]|nr:ATP-binding protein [Polyangiales bacterium]
MELLQLDPQLRPGNAAEVGQRLSAIAALPEGEQLPFSRAYLTTPQLVGRERELATLAARTKRLQAEGRGAGMLLRGAHGVGRSRLLDACVLAGKLSGLGVMHIACATVTRGPYAVAQAIVSQLFDALPDEALQAAQPHAAVLRAAMPALRAKLPADLRGSLPEAEAERGVAAALRELVLQVARQKPLLFAVDDVERSDAQSLGLIALLAHDAATHPLLLIATEGGADGDGSDALRLLADACTRFVLPPLDAEQTQGLLASMLGEVPNLALLVRRLHDLSAGNPQDLLLLCQHLLDRGVLGYRAGAWVVPDRFAVEDLPSSMAQAFAATARALDPDARALGQAFAACPDEAFALDDCVALCGHGDRLRAFAAIDRLFGAGLLVTRGAQYALAAQVWVVALAGDEREPPLHARLSQVFLGRGDGLRAARHLFAAGRENEAFDALLSWAVDSYRDTVGSAEAFVLLVESMPEGWLKICTHALALSGSLGRSQHEIYLLERRVVTLMGQFDVCSDGHHPAYARLLARCAGLDLHAALDPALPAAERLSASLAGAMARFEATPERDRVLDPKQAISELARALITSIGSFSRTVDVEEWSQMPSLATLAPLSPAVAVVDRLARGFDARLAGRFEHACEIYADTLKLIADNGGAGLDPTFRDTVLGALPAITGTIDAVLGRPSAETAAATVEANSLYHGSALEIRWIHKLWLGDVVGADVIARKRELWRLQQPRQDPGAAATMLWTLPALAACDDLTRTRHCLEAIERTAARIRTWEPIASWARAEYERIRGDLDAAVAAADAALLRLPAGKHQVWPLAVATRLKALCAQRRYEEARRDGERDLQLAQSTGLGFAACYLRMPLA